jgi:hypothetical protein
MLEEIKPVQVIISELGEESRERGERLQLPTDSKNWSRHM